MQNVCIFNCYAISNTCLAVLQTFKTEATVAAQVTLVTHGVAFLNIAA
jgi:hypothetical protein